MPCLSKHLQAFHIVGCLAKAKMRPSILRGLHHGQDQPRAVKNEQDMPPQCCDQPLSAILVEHSLSIPAQETFLLAVMKCSRPPEERVVGLDPACGAFLPWQAINVRHLYDRPSVNDPDHPCDLYCIKCKSRICSICSICKKTGHDGNRLCTLTGASNMDRHVPGTTRMVNQELGELSMLSNVMASDSA